MSRELEDGEGAKRGCLLTDGRATMDIYLSKWLMNDRKRNRMSPLSP